MVPGGNEGVGRHYAGGGATPMKGGGFGRGKLPSLARNAMIPAAACCTHGHAGITLRQTVSRQIVVVGRVQGCGERREATYEHVVCGFRDGRGRREPEAPGMCTL